MGKQEATNVGTGRTQAQQWPQSRRALSGGLHGDEQTPNSSAALVSLIGDAKPQKTT